VVSFKHNITNKDEPFVFEMEFMCSLINEYYNLIDYVGKYSNIQSIQQARYCT